MLLTLAALSRLFPLRRSVLRMVTTTDMDDDDVVDVPRQCHDTAIAASSASAASAASAVFFISRRQSTPFSSPTPS